MITDQKLVITIEARMAEFERQLAEEAFPRMVETMRAAILKFKEDTARDPSLDTMRGIIGTACDEFVDNIELQRFITCEAA